MTAIAPILDSPGQSCDRGMAAGSFEPLSREDINDNPTPPWRRNTRVAAGFLALAVGAAALSLLGAPVIGRGGTRWDGGATPVLLAAGPAREPNYTQICEGEKGSITCKNNKVIKITRVFWGRAKVEVCPKLPAGLTADLCETNADNTRHKVNGQCKNQQGCELRASDKFFDDNTCGKVYKYLKVYYDCVPDE